MTSLYMGLGKVTQLNSYGGTSLISYLEFVHSMISCKFKLKNFQLFVFRQQIFETKKVGMNMHCKDKISFKKLISLFQIIL